MAPCVSRRYHKYSSDELREVLRLIAEAEEAREAAMGSILTVSQSPI